MAEPYHLATVEFAVLWRRATDAPCLLGTPRVGATASARAEIAGFCSAELAKRGLGTVDRPHPDLADVIDILAHASHALDVDLAYATGTGRATVTTARAGSAVATSNGREVRLWPIRRDTTVAETVALLPPTPAGAGRSATLHQSDYAAACAAGARDGQSAFLTILRQAGLREPEAYTALAAATGRTGGGHVTARPHTARATWVDTAEGRYLLRDSGDWLTIVPADHARLTAAVADLHAG